MEFIVTLPQGGHPSVVSWNPPPPNDDNDESVLASASASASASPCYYESFLGTVLQSAYPPTTMKMFQSTCWHRHWYVTEQGRVVDADILQRWLQSAAKHSPSLRYLSLRSRLLGGMDRQNRVGSKFGGGGVSSAQQSERERKERLRKLALESIDLAKDPYLVRNHLGSYECKLCLTLHRDEANYLAHTQGKKHQAGLARRAHLEKLKAERDGTSATTANNLSSTTMCRPVLPQPPSKRVKIGRPAYQVFKSRDAVTHQRCLSFELHYPEIDVEQTQPRHRFMSAFEQRVESPPDRNYQYLLFAAEPYETVAFKIPNEPLDKSPDKFVTVWDAEHQKFIVTLYFLNPPSLENNDNKAPHNKTASNSGGTTLPLAGTTVKATS